MSKSEWCTNCCEVDTCKKEITGWRRFNVYEKPYGPVYETEAEAWDTGDVPYTGTFEVYPICR